MVHTPKLAICNFIPDTHALKKMAFAHGFSGVDWTFKVEDLPESSLDELRLVKRIARLHPLEIRYHCAFKGVDLGDEDSNKAEAAMKIFKRVCRLVAELEGRCMTVHLGLGRDSTVGLSWERTLSSLADLVQYGEKHGVCVCLENLAFGWTGRPDLFEKLIRKSNARITLDIGHAKVCSSVESQHYCFEDFVLPHADRVMNAHVYHEEREDRHVPPSALEDMEERLTLLRCLPCDWWTLEIREEEGLLSTLRVIREFLDSAADECTLETLGMR
jgi:sugar phosphate isomerase/epimerase